MNKPNLSKKITPQDVADHAQISYQTATKEFNKMLLYYGKRNRFLTLKEMLRYYHPQVEDDRLHLEIIIKK